MVQIRNMLDFPSWEDVLLAARDYDGEFSNEDEVWSASRQAIKAIRRQDQDRTEKFVRRIRSWGSIQSPGNDAVEPLAKGLIERRSDIAELMDQGVDRTAETHVVDLWQNLVDRTVDRGIASRPLSWSSKLLHWLLPEIHPVYDANVRIALGAVSGRQGYRRIVRWAHKAAGELGAPRAQDRAEFQAPVTTLRLLDKWLWKEGEEG